MTEEERYNRRWAQISYDCWCRNRAMERETKEEIRVVNLHELIRSVIDSDLTEAERAAALMFWYEGLSASSIAAEMKTSRSNVYKTLERVKEKIRLVTKHIVGCPALTVESAE